MCLKLLGEPALVFAAFLLAPMALIAQPVVIPGTTVTIEPPEGFLVSQAFTGLENRETGSSLLIAEFPREAYEQTAPMFNSVEVAAVGFASRGVAILDTTHAIVGGREVPILIGRQTVGGVEATKYFALLAGEQTVLLSFSILAGDPLDAEGVLATVASVQLAGAPTLDEQVEALSFSFETAGQFDVALLIPGGMGVVLTIGGEVPRDDTTPTIVIARGIQAALSQSAIVEASEEMLRCIDGFEDVEITEGHLTEFAGGQGYLARAESGAVAAYQLVFIPGDGRYLQLLATAESETLGALVPAIEQVAASVRLRP